MVFSLNRLEACTATHTETAERHVCKERLLLGASGFSEALAEEKGGDGQSSGSTSGAPPKDLKVEARYCPQCGCKIKHVTFRHELDAP